jgi:hypothetical protein
VICRNYLFLALSFGVDGCILWLERLYALDIECHNNCRVRVLHRIDTNDCKASSSLLHLHLYQSPLCQTRPRQDLLAPPRALRLADLKWALGIQSSTSFHLELSLHPFPLNLTFLPRVPCILRYFSSLRAHDTNSRPTITAYRVAPCSLRLPVSTLSI